MIEFIEIYNKNRVFTGVIDNAISLIWQEEYFTTGYFEIYTAVSENALNLLKIGNFCTKNGDNHAGIIESVQYQDSAQDGAVIIARGRMAKSILDRRLAYSLSGHTITPQKMSGNVAVAVQAVVMNNAGTNAATARKLSGLVAGSTGGITKTIKTADEDNTTRQSSYRNLLEFTDSVLEEFGCGARIRLDNGTLYYDCFEGTNRTYSGGGNPVIFSLDFENLLSANYSQDTTNYKNFALIGGEGEGLARFFATYGSATGYDRREVFVDALSMPKKYKDGDEEKEYTAAEYTLILQGQAQTELRELIITEDFDAKISDESSPFKYGIDYGLGDLVAVQDNRLGIFANVRILSAAEIQDINGYQINITFGGE